MNPNILNPHTFLLGDEANTESVSIYADSMEG